MHHISTAALILEEVPLRDAGAISGVEAIFQAVEGIAFPRKPLGTKRQRALPRNDSQNKMVRYERTLPGIGSPGGTKGVYLAL